MTNDARELEVQELLAENEALSQQLFTARAEVAELKAKVDGLRAEVPFMSIDGASDDE
jgi:predicted RNase H-like nuclease (RuvC/YqgF family)